MKYKPIENVEYLVVHCAATRPSQDIGVADIRRWHRKRGYFDVGYHFVIRRNGTLETGRPIDRPGAHAKGFNQNSIAICLAGGVTEEDVKIPEDNFTVEQKAILRGLLAKLSALFPQATVLGHRDLPHVAKACPSFDVRQWLQGEPNELEAAAISHATGLSGGVPEERLQRRRRCR